MWNEGVEGREREGERGGGEGRERRRREGEERWGSQDRLSNALERIGWRGGRPRLLSWVHHQSLELNSVIWLMRVSVSPFWHEGMRQWCSSFISSQWNPLQSVQKILMCRSHPQRSWLNWSVLWAGQEGFLRLSDSPVQLSWEFVIRICFGTRQCDLRAVEWLPPPHTWMPVTNLSCCMMVPPRRLTPLGQEASSLLVKIRMLLVHVTPWTCKKYILPRIMKTNLERISEVTVQTSKYFYCDFYR